MKMALIQNQPRETKMTNPNDTNVEMPVPSWVGEARDQMFSGHQGLNYENAEVKKRDLPVVECFGNLFAEYELRENDLLVHVFPRGGGEDRYWPCEYKTDGTYIPGRLEETVNGLAFPNDIVNKVKAAADKMWQGDIAVDKATLLHFKDEKAVVESVTKDKPPVEVDLQAYTIQFQSAEQAAKLVGVAKFVDQFCEALDAQLE